MSHTALVLGDQLSHGNPVLEGAGRVLVVESRSALTRLPYHRRRRHLVLSAMRHFAQELRDAGREVHEARLAPTIGAVLRERDWGEVRCAEPNSLPSRRALEKLAEPWTMTDAEQAAAGCVIGRDYPAPIVDHKRERERAVARYRAIAG